MNAKTPDQDIKTIFEKSVRLLSTRETQLNTMHAVLKKTVTIFDSISRTNDNKINIILNDLRASVEDVDLVFFDRKLDEFSNLAKNSNSNKTNATEKKFTSCLLDNLHNYDWSTTTIDFSSLVKSQIGEELSNKEASLQVLNIIDEINSTYNKKLDAERDNYVINLITTISDNTGFDYKIDADSAVNNLNDFLHQLSSFISSLKDNSAYEKNSDKTQAVTVSSKFNSILINVVNDLTFSNKTDKSLQNKILQSLRNPDNTDDYHTNIINEFVMLINKNICSLQHENSDLQEFILKINKQLSDIKSFINISSADQKNTVSRSTALQESVDNSVEFIEDTVSSATSLNAIKNDISVHLKKIRNQVEENTLAEKEQELTAAGNFSNIISELNNSQEELSALKSELKKTKSQLIRDSLTGLYNRAGYDDRIQVEFSRYKRNKTPLCIAMWDIDHFKNINDSYGHDVGDRILKAFSDVIQNRIRKTDMFCRFGGEEFILLMPDTTSDIALVVNDELREIFSSCKFNYNEKEFTVTSSVGIAEFYGNDVSPEVILKEADTALYESKHSGRNRCTVFKR